jgi:iron complex transport system substrate-binding protein
MKIRLLYISIPVVFLILCNSCKNETSLKPTNGLRKNSSKIRYAEGFDIQYFTTHKKLIIKKPYPDASKNLEFILRSSPSKKEDTLSLKTIYVPVKNIVVTSTTHIPMLELLGVEKSLVGFQDTNYISSEKTRKRIDSGFVRELGNEAAMNTEVLFELQPDVVIGFAMNSVNKTYNLIEKHGIPVIINGDWLEETPLGRAEWIKFFGVLFDKEKEADSIFRKIEQEYLAAIIIAKKARNKPSILSGAIMRNDIWSLPAGESFVAQFLEDANVNYLWKDSKGKGSLQLSFESVLDKAQKADYWIAPGYFSSKAQLIENNPHYKNFAAFKTNNIYTASTKKGATGGIIYYELGPTRPDLILKDLIKITNPTLLSNYKLSFFEQMK